MKILLRERSAAVGSSNISSVLISNDDSVVKTRIARKRQENQATQVVFRERSAAFGSFNTSSILFSNDARGS